MGKQIIGIDVGGVIIDREKNDESDTSLFGPNYLNALAVPGALGAIESLSKGTFRDAIYIISKCGENIERRTREWLRYNGVDKIVPEANWCFCRERHQKAPIAKELGLTYFVDDKLEVLHHMWKVVDHRILFRPFAGQTTKWLGESSNGIHIWMNWADLVGWLESLYPAPAISADSIQDLGFKTAELANRIEAESPMYASRLRGLFLSAAGELTCQDEGTLKNSEELKDLLIELHDFDAAEILRDMLRAKRKGEKLNA